MAHVDSCVRIHEDLVRNSSKREREIKDVPITGNQSSSHVTEFNAINMPLYKLFRHALFASLNLENSTAWFRFQVANHLMRLLEH